MWTDFILSYQCACPLPNTPVCSPVYYLEWVVPEKIHISTPPEKICAVQREGKSLGSLQSFPLWGEHGYFLQRPILNELKT